MRVWRTKKWKLIMDYKNTYRHELYNLEKDPEETTNVFDRPENQKLITQLEGKLIQKMKIINDTVWKITDKTEK